MQWLESVSAGFEVTITERNEFAMIAIQGPNAKAKAGFLFAEADNASC